MQAGEIDQTNGQTDSKAYPNPRNVARMIVINNNKIISAAFRTSSLFTVIAALLRIASLSVSAGQFRNDLTSAWLAITVVAVGSLIASGILSHALRRCPVCQTRIIAETGRKRFCQGCGTELWDHLDKIDG